MNPRRPGVILFALILASPCLAGALKRPVFADMERKIDGRIQRAIPEDPFLLLGNTRGFYLENYGAVFTAEVNLLNTPTISPFRQTIPKEDVVKVHKRKVERLAALKQHMRTALLALAATLDDVPPGEQIVLGMALFYFSWEDTTGLPSQVLMQGEKRRLIDVQAGRGSAGSAIEVREF